MKKETKTTVIEQLRTYIESYPNFYLTNIEALNADVYKRQTLEPQSPPSKSY